MDKIMDSVLCSDSDDEPRFRQILENLIADGSIEAYSAFTNEKKSKATARKRKVRLAVVKMGHLTVLQTHNRFGDRRFAVAGPGL